MEHRNWTETDSGRTVAKWNRSTGGYCRNSWRVRWTECGRFSDWWWNMEWEVSAVLPSSVLMEIAANKIRNDSEQEFSRYEFIHQKDDAAQSRIKLLVEEGTISSKRSRADLDVWRWEELQRIWAFPMVGNKQRLTNSERCRKHISILASCQGALS